MKKREVVSGLILIFSTVFACYIFPSNEQVSETVIEEVSFGKCTDGDTAHFIIDGKDTTVRLLAIDTPETKHPKKGVESYGVEASEFTCNAISKAKKIHLEYEEGNRVDKYDRILAWVFVDDQLLQSQLIENGLAKVDYIYGNYKYTDQLYDAESEAKSSDIGIWIENY